MQPYHIAIQNQNIDSTNTDCQNMNETNGVPDMLLVLLAKNKLLECMY